MVFVSKAFTVLPSTTVDRPQKLPTSTTAGLPGKAPRACVTAVISRLASESWSHPCTCLIATRTDSCRSFLTECILAADRLVTSTDISPFSEAPVAVANGIRNAFPLMCSCPASTHITPLHNLPVPGCAETEPRGLAIALQVLEALRAD